MPPTPPIIRASKVCREFVHGQERVQAVREVDMELVPGRLALIRGKSGSGKTTLLNIIGGLDRPPPASCSTKSATCTSFRNAR